MSLKSDKPSNRRLIPQNAPLAEQLAKALGIGSPYWATSFLACACGVVRRLFVRVGVSARFANAALRNYSDHSGVALGHNVLEPCSLRMASAVWLGYTRASRLALKWSLNLAPVLKSFLVLAIGCSG